MSGEVTVSSSNFSEEVLKSDKPVLVDFWADWCMPCKILGPIIESIAKDYSDKIKVAKLNVDEAGDVASQYNIISIPTLIIFKDGKPVKQRVGAGSKKALEEFISQYI